MARDGGDAIAAADEDFLRAVGAEEPDAPLWIEVRRIQADLCGVPREAVHPEDRLDDLWPDDWWGPDRLDLVFRLERALRVRIPIAAVEPIFIDRTIREFGPFAARMVALIRRLREQAG
jgi:hypothetical protein